MTVCTLSQIIIGLIFVVYVSIIELRYKMYAVIGIKTYIQATQ